VKTAAIPAAFLNELQNYINVYDISKGKGKYFWRGSCKVLRVNKNNDVAFISFLIKMENAPQKRGILKA